MKLGIIAPYRKRPGHLRRFKEHILEYLKDYDFELIVVEQADDLPFNRGKLLNVGFKTAVRKQCDYVVFHDLDMLPIDVDYSYSEVPLHLATNFTNSKRELFKTYFGGVTMFPVPLFQKVNGYSNEYWGWGFEDDDLLKRLTETNVLTDFEYYEVPKHLTSGINIHGDRSYVECPNIINVRKDFTIQITFKPDEIVCDYEKPYDDYSVFSIPGYNISISFNSFNRYKFECWDKRKNLFHIDSNYDYSRLTQIVITYEKESGVLMMYQDGKEIEGTLIIPELIDTSPPNFFIGTGIDEMEGVDIRSFRGFVKDFCYWDTSLAANEVQEFMSNPAMGYLNDTGEYSSSRKLKLYLDFKHLKLNNSFQYEKGKVMNLVNPRYQAVTYNCIPKSQLELDRKKIAIPARRKSTFKLLKHKPQGYTDGSWKSRVTRLNQIRFYDVVLNNKTNYKKEGLSSIRFKKISETSVDNYTMLSVDLTGGPRDVGIIKNYMDEISKEDK
jgi:hypothetical protein